MSQDLYGQLAFDDFDKALAKAFWHRWLDRLTRRPNKLLSFDEIMQRRPITGQRSLGTLTVAVNHIIGSVGRANDFDRDFMPLNKSLSDRWMKIDRAWHRGESLPPVELYKIGDCYFVVDGNHRVSVAHAQGQEYIDAEVTEIDTPMTATLETKIVSPN
jgi:hypothetical protein